jgi:peptidoglycan-N-acetylglucosamine deacetylase
MVRHKLGVAAAAVVLLALAWIWPEGSEPLASATTGNEPTAPEGTPSVSAGHGEAEDTGSPESPLPSAEPGPVVLSPPAASASPLAEPPPDVHRGPMGTRDRTGDGSVALTFDDGPSPEWTPRVLDLLREQGAKATFCVIGAYAEAYPELVADIAREGHTLCNHSWFHEFDLGSWSEEEIRANLRRTNDAILRAAPGAEVAYFRQPGGKWTNRVVAVAAELGMESLHWTVDPSDWDGSSTEAKIRDRLLEATGPGSVVLLHDGASNQAAMYGALPRVFAEFADRGYVFSAL